VGALAGVVDEGIISTWCWLGADSHGFEEIALSWYVAVALIFAMFVCDSRLPNGPNSSAQPGYDGPVLLAASIHHIHHWYDLTWVDWITVIALPLALAGLCLTWWQAKAAADSAKAAQRAVRRTEQQIRANQLMVLAPQLSWTVAELDSAIRDDNPELAQRDLNSWRWQASRIQGILSAAEPGERKLREALQEGVGQAQIAGSILMTDKGVPVAARCMQARNKVVAASDDLSAWIGRYSTRVLPGESEGQ
jgi:hypothetical protein